MVFLVKLVFDMSIGEMRDCGEANEANALSDKKYSLLIGQ